MILIREAMRVDLSEITEIYNQAILTTDAVMHTEPRSTEERETWFAQHGGKYPILVAELTPNQNQGKIAGWGSLSPWSERCGYAGTVELSVYIKEEYRGKGFGKKLVQALVEAGEKSGHHCIISLITATNEASIRLHEKFGFIPAGLMKEVGYKFNHWIDVAILQKMLHD